MPESHRRPHTASFDSPASLLLIVAAMIVGWGAVGCGAGTHEPGPSTQVAVDAPTSPPDASTAAVSRDTRPLSSVHVVEETTASWLETDDTYYPKGFEAAGFGLRPRDREEDSIAAILSISKQSERRDCRSTPPSRRTCDIVHKATGRVVGTSDQTGGTRRVEGDYVFGTGYYVRIRHDLDHDIGPSGGAGTRNERIRLYVDGTTYERSGPARRAGWHSGQFQVSDFVWELFGEGFEGVSSLERWSDRVTRLADEELDGTSAAHYRAERDTPQGGRVRVDLWTDPETGFPVKMVREVDGPDATERSVYLFSEFNEVELPDVPQTAESYSPFRSSVEGQSHMTSASLPTN